MKVQARPPTCLAGPSNLLEPNANTFNKALIITKKHSSLKTRKERLMLSIQNDVEFFNKQNKQLNGTTRNSSLSIIDRMISKDYIHRLNLQLSPIKLPVKTSRSRMAPTSLPPPFPPPIQIGSRVSMTKHEGVLLQKRGLLKTLTRARQKQMDRTGDRGNNVLSVNLARLEMEIQELIEITSGGGGGGGGGGAVPGKNDYSKFMVSPIKKPPPSSLQSKQAQKTFSSNDHDLTLFKFARTGKWSDQLEKNKTSKKNKKNKKNNTHCKNQTTTTHKTNKTTNAHETHTNSKTNMDHWFDASKSKNELLRMPMKETPNTTTHHYQTTPPAAQLGSPTARHSPFPAHSSNKPPSRVGGSILHNILQPPRTASTSESSRRVTWSPMPDQHHRLKFSSKPLLLPVAAIQHPDLLDIPSTAEMGRRLMSRRSEYRMVMGRKTGIEIKQKNAKRRLSALQATTRALGRLQMRKKRESIKKQKDEKRRNSVLGQYVTENL